MRISLLAALAALSVNSAIFAEEKEPTIAEQAAKLPKIPPKSPQESLKAMQLADGFKVSLVAAEPLVRDPVAIDFDENGRMYVVELPAYNGYAVKDFKGTGSVRLLEDTDDDGRYDKSSIFLADLAYPTAVACWAGGVFVGASPDLFYAKDTDGDGKADERRVIFTGFGADKAGEAHLNSFRWGYDNRIHVSTNLSGGDIRITDNPDAPAVSVRGRGFIFDPRDTSKFELTSGGGQHGMSMDNWGHKFVCSNSVPAQTLMYDDRYVARNPHLQAPAAAVDIAPEGKFTTLYRISEPEPWRELRTRLRKTGKFRGSDEGGKPFGFFTGATGITIYRGDAWPESHRGNLIVGDVANNLIYRATLEYDGLRLIARRADKGREFLTTRDIWTRPVQFANAPDGTLYVLDIYRGLIEGAAFLPPEFLEFLDPISGNDRGRIYRIEPKGFQRRSTPRLGDLPSKVVALLDHPNGWHRDTASRLIYESQSGTLLNELELLVATGKLAEGRMMALYSLDGLGLLDQGVVLQALDDASPLVRAHALQLGEQFAATSPAIVARMCEMTSDDDLRVRYQLAFSLGAGRGSARNAALAKLAIQDGADSWMRLAVLSSLRDGSGEVFEAIASDGKFREPPSRALLLALARQIGASNRKDEIAAFLKVLSLLPDEERPLAQELVKAAAEQLAGDDRERMLVAGDGKAGMLLGQLLNEAKAKAGEGNPLAVRVEAIRSLRLLPWPRVEKHFRRLLYLSQPVQIQTAVIESLAEYKDPAAAKMMLDGWLFLSPKLRASAAEALMSRPAWIGLLLDRVEGGIVKRGDLDPARVGLLKKHPDAKIAARVSKLFAASALPQRKEVMDKYQPALKMVGDGDRGKAVFKKVCSACHKLEGVGTAVGADLKGIRNRGLAAVMLNILDPNREVKPQFQAYVIATEDGRVTTGMIEAENANSLTVRRSDGTTVVIQRTQIDELNSTGVSFMPEGLEKQVDPQAMADLLQYLDTLP